MPDQPPFEHSVLEADIRKLAEEIQRHRERPELKGASERELVKEAVRSVAPTPVAPQPQPQASASQSPLPDYARSAPADIKLEVEYLLDLAFHKGIGLAISEAKKSSDFVQDVFHDALAGKLYPELQKRGILK